MVGKDDWKVEEILRKREEYELRAAVDHGTFLAVLTIIHMYIWMHVYAHICINVYMYVCICA